MKPSFTRSLCTLFAAVLVTGSVAHAQYSTDFESFSSPNTPTDPVNGQQGWITNDTLRPGTVGTTQIVGESNYVGGTGYFNGQSAFIGGGYRTTAANATTALPDVVPSTVTGGIATLARPFTLAAGSYSFNVDFAVTSSSTDFAARDAFRWTFGNGTNTSFSINFTPDGAGQNRIGYTVGGGATTLTPNAVVLNGQYHLTVNVTTGAAPAFAATISSGSNSTTFTSTLLGATLAPGSVNQIAATWVLADQTNTNGGYQNAGSNVLVFDNYSVVPEPSTYVMMTLGMMVMIGMLRLRRASI